jgi:membrane protein
VAIATTHGRAHVRQWLRMFVDCFVEHDLLTYASAISFQLLSSLVPLLLFAFGVLGFLNLEDVWRAGLAPEIRPNVSPTAYAMMDQVVETALRSKQVFWVTAGFAIALWELSGAVRAVMGALNTIYRDPTERSWRRRMGVSTALALVVGACVLGAVAIVTVVPLLVGDVSPALSAALFLAEWAVSGLLLLVAVAAMLHYAPERHQPLHFVTFGSLLIMGGWLVMSAGFGIYLREIASYNSVFGSLATVVVLIAYLYASALVFLGGVQVDALRRVS